MSPAGASCSLLRSRLHAGVSLASAVAALALAVPAAAQTAQGEDSRLRLDPGVDRRSSVAERQAVESTEIPTRITLDGETYPVRDDPDNMARALYLSVERKKWPDVRRFLPAYLALPGHDLMLVAWARGGLARAEGRLKAAERAYRAVLAIQPDFLPARLELGRVLFENRKDREALRLFRDIRRELAAEGNKAAGVRATVDTFVAVLDRRRGWQGTMAIGPSYSSNLNQTSASQTCLLLDDEGACLIDRTMPAAIRGTGINYEGSGVRRVPLAGHGGILARGLLYGDIWPAHGEFSQATISTQIGYDHQTATRSLTLSPTFDAATLGRHLLYTATGVRAEAMATISPSTTLRLDVSRRAFDYPGAGFDDLDGALIEASVTGWLALPRGWTLFGGLEAGDKDADEGPNAYRHVGARVGLAHAFSDWADVTLIASARRRTHRAYSELLEATRRDREANLTAVIRMPKLRFAGLSPNILLQHNRVKSNVDWLYSFRRTSAAIRLEHVF
jgi:hypothetical protein